jgi:hypothetical protein
MSKLSDRISGLKRSSGIRGLGTGFRKNVMMNILTKEFPNIDPDLIYAKILAGKND